MTNFNDQTKTRSYWKVTVKRHGIGDAEPSFTRGKGSQQPRYNSNPPPIKITLDSQVHCSTGSPNRNLHPHFHPRHHILQKKKHSFSITKSVLSSNTPPTSISPKNTDSSYPSLPPKSRPYIHLLNLPQLIKHPLRRPSQPHRRRSMVRSPSSHTPPHHGSRITARQPGIRRPARRRRVSRLDRSLP